MDSRGESDAINAEIRRQGWIGANFEFWIGAEDAAGEGVWRWATSGRGLDGGFQVLDTFSRFLISDFCRTGMRTSQTTRMGRRTALTSLSSSAPAGTA